MVAHSFKIFCEHERLDEVRCDAALVLNAPHHIGFHTFEQRINLRIFPNRRTSAFGVALHERFGGVMQNNAGSIAHLTQVR